MYLNKKSPVVVERDEHDGDRTRCVHFYCISNRMFSISFSVSKTQNVQFVTFTALYSFVWISIHCRKNSVFYFLSNFAKK